MFWSSESTAGSPSASSSINFVLGPSFLHTWHQRKLINVGGLIIRIGFWGTIYYKYNKEPPK